MHNLQCIRRLGTGPQSFTRRQHQQQKPVGSCLTFQQLYRTDGEPQHRPLGSSEPQQLYQFGEPRQFDSIAPGQPQCLVIA